MLIVLFNSISENSMDDIKKIIKKLNELLKPCQLGIKFRLCEDTNEEHFCLLNLNETIAAVKWVFNISFRLL